MALQRGIKIGTGFVVLLLMLGGLESIATAQSRSTDPVIAALDAAIQSLKEQPSQFHLSVTAIGAMGVASGSGTGIRVEARGGQAGSQTTGLVASASSGDITIAQARATERLKEEADKAIKLLSEIKVLAQAPKPDQPTLTSKLSELAKTYVAPVLTAVVTALIKAKFRLP